MHQVCGYPCENGILTMFFQKLSFVTLGSSNNLITLSDTMAHHCEDLKFTII